MRYRLISVAAAAAFAGAATIAAAQDEKGKAQGVEQQAPGAGKAEKPAQKSMPQRETGRDKASSTEPRQGSDKDQPKAAQQPGTSERPKSTQQQAPERDRPKAAQQPKADQDRSQDQPKATEQRKATGDDQKKAAEPSAKDSKQKAAEPKQEPGKDRPKAADQAQPGKDKSAEQNRDKASGRVQVSEQQRTDIRQRLVKETRVEKTKINVTVNVGTTIPRSVRLHTLPIGIVAIAPAYRGYHYVVLEDETIVIVDPRTYVVVDLISSGGPHRAQLTLSTDDRRFIFSTLPKNRTADVRVRLALGAEVPRSVELHTFPTVVVERVPDMRRYRYIVVEDDIVVVDPNDHAVVMVIEN
jgi:hypothetical protein